MTRYQIADVALVVERILGKDEVVGSNPIISTNADVAQLVEQRIENPCVTGSNPVFGTIKL